jgi:hypothetical protein
VGGSGLWQVDAGSNANPAAQISGGTPPYNVIWHLDGNQIMEFNGVVGLGGSSENVSIPTTNSMVGNHTITINAIDAVGEAASFKGKLVVYQPITAGDPGVILTRNVVDVGQTVGLEINVSGGIPFYYTYWYINGNAITDFSVPFGSGDITFTSNSTDLGNVIVSANVLDNFGGSGTTFGGIHSTTVNGLLIVNTQLSFGAGNIIVPQATITKGSGENLSANVIGGTLPYSYQWTINSNVISGNSPIFAINGTALGSDVVGLSVNDAAGESISANATINVTAAPSSPQLQQSSGGSSGGGGGGSSVPIVTPPNTTTLTTSVSTSTITTTVLPQTTVPTTTIVQATNQSSGSGGVNSQDNSPPASNAALVNDEIAAGVTVVVVAALGAGFYHFRPRRKIKR